MIKVEFYMGFSRLDRVYYCMKGSSPTIPKCRTGVILEINTGKESVEFTIFGEDNNSVTVPYEHVFKDRQLCLAYVASCS